MDEKLTYQELEDKLKSLQFEYAEQLEKEKFRYKTLFENTGTATCIFGDNSIITLCNEEFENLTGYSRTEIEGKMRWQDFVDKSDLDRMLEYHKKRQEQTGNPPTEYEFILINRAGEHRHIHLKIGILDETKERVASLNDITIHKHTQDELEESHRMLETLMDNLPGMVYRCRNDKNWSMIYLSQGCKSLTGYSPQTFKNNHQLNYGDLIHPEDAEYVWQAVQKSIDNESHFEIEYRIYNAKNELRWVWERGKIIGEDPQGNKYLEGFIMDITENQEARNALIESEEKYRLLAETARDIIGIHDMDGYITYMNEAALRFLEMEITEVIGRPIIDFLPKENLEDLRKRRDLRKSGNNERFVYETVFLGKNNKRIPVEVSSSVLKKEGVPTGVLLIARDITERKVAEREIKASEEQYRALFETTGTATIVYDRDKVVRMCNKKFEELFGKERSEIIDKIQWTDFVHPDDLPRMMEYHRLRGQGSKKPPLEYEFKFLNAKGAVRYVYHTVKFLEESRYRIASFADITDLKEAESALKTSEERLKLAIEGGGLGLWDWNIQTGKVFFNENWARIIGFKLEELPGIVGTWESLVHPDDWEAVGRKLNDHLQGNSDRYYAEYRIRCKSGEYKYISDTGNVVKRDNQGNALRMVGIHKDINDRKVAEIKLQNWNKELEERVQERTVQLEETNKELESFSYSVSHDLKAPLRAIDGFSRVLEEDYEKALDSEAKRYLDIIRSNIRKMNQLISDLLAFSRLGRKSLRPQIIDTESLVEEIYSDIREEQKDHEFIVKNLPDLYADRGMMKIVFSNLIHNAFKFSAGSEKTTIEIGCIPKSGMNTFYVRDNGVGFNMQYVNKVFETFQRLHHEDEFKGTGIGLSLVQRVINKHGGKIWAESTEGEGATFYFFLPEIDKNKKNK